VTVLEELANIATFLEDDEMADDVLHDIGDPAAAARRLSLTTNRTGPRRPAREAAAAEAAADGARTRTGRPRPATDPG